MSKVKTYKTCFVPLCKSTVIKTPAKLFFYVPQDKNVRKRWFESAHRTDEPGKWSYFCCQDHFDLKEDMDNYIRYCMMGAPVKLKKGVVPHIFDCQPYRVKTSNNLSRPAYKKLNRKREIADILSDAENQNENNFPTASPQQPPHKIRKNFLDLTNSDNNTLTSHEQSIYTPSTSEINSEINSGNTSVVAESTSQISHFSQRSVGVQVVGKLVKPHVRSKSTMCMPCTTDAFCQTQVEVLNRTCSPIKSLLRTPAIAANSSTSSSAIASCSSEYQWSSSHSEYKYSSSCSEERKENNKNIKESALNITRYFISVDAKKYIGIGNEWLWIIDVLHSSTQCSIDDIKLTLMKIRINDTFSRLGDQFGLSTSQASRVFNKTVKLLAHYLKTLVYCPDPSSIKKNLPVAFRAYYSHVCAILDAFEIEIEKPSNPVQQALTWSEYKKCNTLKYLIVCTPDGFITFISSGYGGRISDTLLFEESKVMNILPEKRGVMADRGFKQIQTVLNQKKCELLRPPSVSASTKSTKEEVLKTKSIASLRIHIERVIRRVREYKILEPHSCLDWNTMPYIDSITTIVAGLINLQKPIIKK